MPGESSNLADAFRVEQVGAPSPFWKIICCAGRISNRSAVTINGIALNQSQRAGVSFSRLSLYRDRASSIGASTGGKGVGAENGRNAPAAKFWGVGGVLGTTCSGARPRQGCRWRFVDGPEKQFFGSEEQDTGFRSRLKRQSPLSPAEARA
jgi:hypothetical protein